MIPGVEASSIEVVLLTRLVIAVKGSDTRFEDWLIGRSAVQHTTIDQLVHMRPVRQSSRGCNCLCTLTMHLWHWYSHQHPSEPHWWRIRRPISTSHDPKRFGLIQLGTTIIVALLLLILLLLLLLLQERHAFPTLAGSLLMSTNPNGGFLVVACESQLCVALLLPNPTAKASHLTISYPTYDSSHHS